MTVVVVYESMYGNTHLIAEAIAQGAAEAGAATEVVSVEAAVRRTAHPEDLLIVGGPTHVHGLSRAATREAAVQDAPGRQLEVDPAVDGPGLREWLGSLETPGGRAAAFDTRAKGPAVLTGRASQKIARALRQHGFELLAEPESFLVTAANQLLPGEESRARQWGAGLVTRL